MSKSKNILCICFLVLGFLFFPMASVVNAAEKEKATVYVFHSNTCPHCQSAIAYFKKLLANEEFKDIFQVRTIETSKYNEISNEASEAMRGQKINGVPYIVIGEKEFEGYSSSSNESIKAAIKEAYDSGVDKIHDIVGEAGELLEAEESTMMTTIIVVAIALLIIGGTIYFARNGSEEEEELPKKENKEEKQEEKAIEKVKVEPKTNGGKKQNTNKKKSNTKKNTKK